MKSTCRSQADEQNFPLSLVGGSTSYGSFPENGKGVDAGIIQLPILEEINTANVC